MDNNKFLFVCACACACHSHFLVWRGIKKNNSKGFANNHPSLPRDEGQGPDCPISFIFLLIVCYPKNTSRSYFLFLFITFSFNIRRNTWRFMEDALFNKKIHCSSAKSAKLFKLLQKTFKVLSWGEKGFIQFQSIFF